MKDLRLSLLIPTYNEEEIIGTALREIADSLGPDFSSQTEILIVDDGTDNLHTTVPSMASGLPFAQVQVLRNAPPLGKGKSLALGFEKAAGKTVGFLDVDLSTPPKYIPVAVESIESGQSDIFIGSRRAPGSQVNRQQFFLKDILGNILGVIARGIIFQGMTSYRDTQCGFKFYENRIAKILYRDLAAPDGLNDLEVLLRANLLEMRVKEMGVQWTDLRESKRTLRRILLGEIKAILKILWLYKIQARQQRTRLREWASENPWPK